MYMYLCQFSKMKNVQKLYFSSFKWYVSTYIATPPIEWYIWGSVPFSTILGLQLYSFPSKFVALNTIPPHNLFVNKPFTLSPRMLFPEMLYICFLLLYLLTAFRVLKVQWFGLVYVIKFVRDLR